MKTSTKAQVTLVNNSGYTTMPLDLRTETAFGIQSERPWSDLDPLVIVDEMYEYTANGCVDVYLRNDDGELMGWAHIGRSFDIHVGDMLVLMATYVRPAYRNMGVAATFIRVLKDIARTTGTRWCGYTHWDKPRTLVHRYIDLGEQPNG